MKRHFLKPLFAAVVLGSLSACGGSDDDTQVSPPTSTPVPPPVPGPSPVPPQALPAQLPAIFSWTSPTSLSGSTQLVRNGATGSAEGQVYSFATNSSSRITVSGGAVISTMSNIADQGAVLQLCRAAGSRGTVSVLVGTGLLPVSSSDVEGLTFDEVLCNTSSGDFSPSGSFAVVNGGTAIIFDNATTEGGRLAVADLFGSGSNAYQAEVGTVRWRAYRRPGGSIVIVETQTGGTNPPPNVEPANVFLRIQRR